MFFMSAWQSVAVALVGVVLGCGAILAFALARVAARADQEIEMMMAGVCRATETTAATHSARGNRSLTRSARIVTSQLVASR